MLSQRQQPVFSEYAGTRVGLLRPSVLCPNGLHALNVFQGLVHRLEGVVLGGHAFDIRFGVLRESPMIDTAATFTADLFKRFAHGRHRVPFGVRASR